MVKLVDGLGVVVAATVEACAVVVLGLGHPVKAERMTKEIIAAAQILTAIFSLHRFKVLIINYNTENRVNYMGSFLMRVQLWVRIK